MFDNLSDFPGEVCIKIIYCRT